jgi:RNA polymerase sigma-70 factor (ECF subfamily)
MRNIDSSPGSAKPENLLGCAQEGDNVALGKLLNVYRRYLALLARTQIGRRLQGKADASDLVQETMLEAHCHFHQFRGTTEAEFAGWLRSILAGLMANHIRHFLGTKQRDVRLEQTLAVEMNDTSCRLDRRLAAAVSSPSEQAVKHESALALANALETLPEHYRQVIVLRHLEGLSFAEVAKQMERSIDSVEKLWVRALSQLRTSLGETS